MSLDYHVKDQHMHYTNLYVTSTCQLGDEELNIKEFTNDLDTLYHITHHVY